VSAHALDELNGRPLRTRISDATLVLLAAVSLGGACVIGGWAASAWGWGLLAFVAVGAFVVPAYNLELFGGRFHTAWWFAFAWGIFPVLTAYFAQAGTIRAPALLAAGFAFGTTLAQRALSTPVRHARRVLGTTEGVEPMERALRIMPWANVLLGAALIVLRLT
jgi:hypothetical protein